MTNTETGERAALTDEHVAIMRELAEYIATTDDEYIATPTVVLRALLVGYDDLRAVRTDGTRLADLIIGHGRPVYPADGIFPESVMVDMGTWKCMCALAMALLTDDAATDGGAE